MLSDTVVEDHTSSFEFLGDFAYDKIGNDYIDFLLCAMYNKNGKV